MLAGTPGDFPIGRGVTRLILEEDGNTAMFPVAVSFTVMSFNQYYPVTIILQCTSHLYLGVSRVVLPRQQVAQRSGLAHCMVQGARVSYRGVSPGKSPPPPNLKSCM